MIHLLHASFHVTAMMSPVWFPDPTFRTVLGPPIKLANKNILCIELLQPWCIWIFNNIDLAIGRPRMTAPLSMRFTSQRPTRLLRPIQPSQRRIGPQRQISRVKLHDQQQAQVRDGHGQQQDKVDDEKSNRGATAPMLGTKEEIMY